MAAAIEARLALGLSIAPQTELWLTSGWDYRFVRTHRDFEFALGGPLGGSWVAGLGLEVLPNTLAITH